jgi:hypothetical protein
MGGVKAKFHTHSSHFLQMEMSGKLQAPAVTHVIRDWVSSEAHMHMIVKTKSCLYRESNFDYSAQSFISLSLLSHSPN